MGALVADVVLRQCVMDGAGIDRLRQNGAAVREWVGSSEEVCPEDRRALLAASVFFKFDCIHAAMTAPNGAPLPAEAQPYASEIGHLQQLRSNAGCYLPFFCSSKNAGPKSPTPEMRREFDSPYGGLDGGAISN